MGDTSGGSGREWDGGVPSRDWDPQGTVFLKKFKTTGHRPSSLIQFIYMYVEIKLKSGYKTDYLHFS